MAQSFLNEDELYVPEDIIKEARSVIENLLPRKSVSLYEKEYNIFCAWRKSRNIKGVSEEIPGLRNNIRKGVTTLVVFL
jgi:hypothetical protein